MWAKIIFARVNTEFPPVVSTLSIACMFVVQYLKSTNQSGSKMYIHRNRGYKSEDHKNWRIL